MALRLFNDWKIRNAVLAVMLVLVVPPFVLSALVGYLTNRDEELKSIDEKLYAAAVFAEQVLPENYHDRITGPGSVPPEEFNRIVDRFNRICTELNLEYLWSLMLIDGQPVFTSSTSPDKKVENGRHAKFFELHSNPELYEKAFRTMQPQYQINADKWGTIRAVLLPRTDSRGRKYLIGASMKQAVVEGLMPKLFHDALANAFIFLVPGILLSVLLSKWITRPIRALAEAAETIGAGNYDHRIELSAPREVNVVALQLNAMCASIRSQIASLQEALERQEDFRKSVNNSPAIFSRARFAPGYPLEFISDNISVTGFSARQLMSGEAAWSDFIPEEDLLRARALLNEVQESGEETYKIEIRLLWADGDTHWYESWGRIVKDAEGAPAAVHTFLIDITEEKKIRQQNEEHRRRLQESVNELKKAQERDIQYQHRLKALAEELVQVEDRERRQLATALHDDVGQMLAALNMKLSVLKETSDRARIDELVPQVEDLLALIMRSCKTLTWEISPTSLYETDLGAGLQHMAADIETYFGINVTVQTPHCRIAASRERSALIFRCAKELLVNIAKHSGTDSAELGLSQERDGIRLTVADQGRGFDPQLINGNSTSGFGLFSIRERIQYIQGRMVIESAPNEGSRITILFPEQPGS